MEIKRSNNYDEILEVLKVCSDDFYNQALNNEEDIKKLALKFSQYAIVDIAYDDNKITGFIAYYCNDVETKCAFISMIIIHSDYQGLGVGSILLNGMREECKSRGFTSIKLEVAKTNLKAKRFYEAKGFECLADETEQSNYYLLTM